LAKYFLAKENQIPSKENKSVLWTRFNFYFNGHIRPNPLWDYLSLCISGYAKVTLNPEEKTGVQKEIIFPVMARANHDTPEGYVVLRVD